MRRRAPAARAAPAPQTCPAETGDRRREEGEAATAGGAAARPAGSRAQGPAASGFSPRAPPHPPPPPAAAPRSRGWQVGTHPPCGGRSGPRPGGAGGGEDSRGLPRRTAVKVFLGIFQPLCSKALPRRRTHTPPCAPAPPPPPPSSLPLSLSFLGGPGCSAAGATTPLSCSFEHFPSPEYHSQGQGAGEPGGRGGGHGRDTVPRATQGQRKCAGGECAGQAGGPEPCGRARQQLHRHLVGRCSQPGSPRRSVCITRAHTYLQFTGEPPGLETQFCTNAAHGWAPGTWDRTGPHYGPLVLYSLAASPFCSPRRPQESSPRCRASAGILLPG